MTAAVLMIWAHGVALGLWVGWARWRRPALIATMEPDMSKRITPATSAASKRAAFAGQRQKFAAGGRAKAYGPTAREKRVARSLRDDLAAMGVSVKEICGHWIAI